MDQHGIYFGIKGIKPTVNLGEPAIGGIFVVPFVSTFRPKLTPKP